MCAPSWCLDEGVFNKMQTLFDKYIMTMFKKYPIIYQGIGKTYFETKMLVMDQLLNVVGNGINTDEELLEHLNEIDLTVTRKDIVKYLQEDIYFPDNGNKSREFLTETEIKSRPDENWIYCKGITFKPYPNFREEYSTVYECPAYLDLDVSFINGAIEFYDYCIVWFSDPANRHYQSRYSSTDKEWRKERSRIFKFLHKTIRMLEDTKK